jgi:H+/Cl- antiporter ClcA
MNNIYIWLILGAVSVIFAIFSRIAAHKERSKSWWFFEVWRDFVNYFITGVIGYFFVAIRWPNIEKSGNLSVSDFFLCFAFFIGALGWWPYVFKNITEKIDAIFERALKK